RPAAAGVAGLPLLEAGVQRRPARPPPLSPVCHMTDRLQNYSYFTLIGLLARIVGRIDVVDASRPDELNLDDRLLISRPNKMRVSCRVREERARLGQPGLVVEFFTHAKADAAAEQSDGFGIGVGMRWHLVVGWQL